MDANITLHMLFRPDIRQNLETAFNRCSEVARLDGEGTILGRIREIARYENDAATSFHAYADMGMQVELYENRFQDGLKLAAEWRQGGTACP